VQEHNQPKPTCGAIVKRLFTEKVCAEPAVDMTTLLDPDNRTTVQGILLTCEKHSKDLEKGKKVIFFAEAKDGKPNERVAIQFSRKK
jgi:hypothetical protein